MRLLDQLNEQQVEAVTSSSPYVRVIAGAGSGKTRVLMARLLYLMEEKGVAPSALCAITFTNKAAQEMKDRLDQAINLGAYRPWISTIHALCVRILRQDIGALGYPKNFVIVDSNDQRALVKQAYKDLDIDPKRVSYSSMLAMISDFKSHDMTVDMAKQALEEQGQNGRLALVYEAYLSRLKAMKALDFDDLLLFVNRLFDRFPDVLHYWQARFKHILVDEFQDIDKVQYQIIKHLAGPHNHLYVVGDPDQTIYTWRGADVSIILDFKRHFQPCHSIFLNQNYRSSQPILLAANSLIRHNTNREDKKLFSDRPSTDLVDHYSFSGFDRQAEWISEDIRKHYHQGVSYQEMAILYRSNYLSRELEKALIMANIPYLIYGGVRFFDRMEVKDLLSYLRVVVLGDDLAFERTINQPKRKIGLKTMDKLRTYAKDHSTSLLEAARCHPDVTSGQRKTLDSYVALIDSMRDRLDTWSLEDILRSLFTESGLLDLYQKDKDQDRIDNLNELIYDAQRFMDDNDEATIEDYLDSLALYADKSQDQGDSVSLMTVHAAKGLEFDRVYLAGFNEGIFPNDRTLVESGEEGLEEERRLAYVAFTRAKQKLVLCDVTGYLFISDQMGRPSRFLNEIDDKALVNHSQNDYGKIQTNPTTSLDQVVHANQRPRLRVGDMVVHPIFGKGILVKMDNDLVQVAFSDVGLKTLSLAHAHLEKS